MTSQGLPVQPRPDVAAAPANLREIGAVLKRSFEGFKDAVGETFDDRRDVLDPGDANLNRPPAEVEDEAERDADRAAERAERDRPRAVQGPAPPAIAFTRFATTGREQLERRRRGAALDRPRRPPGARLRRLPRARPLRPQAQAGGQGAYVEWEIAHAPRRARPAAGERGPDAGFKRADHWAARQAGRAVRARRGRRRRTGRAAPACSRRTASGCTGCSTCAGRSTEDGTDWIAASSRASCSSPGRWTAITARPAGDDGAGAARAGPAAVPRRDPRLGGGRGVGLTAPLRPAAHPVAAPAPAEHMARAARRRTWTSSACAARTPTACRSRAPPSARIADLSMASWSQEPRAREAPVRDGKGGVMHVAEHVVIAYRDSADYEQGRGRWRAYQQRGAARPAGSPDRRAPADRGRRPPAPVVPLRGLRHVRPASAPCPRFPQIFNRNQRPSLGPYCGELED